MASVKEDFLKSIAKIDDEIVQLTKKSRNEGSVRTGLQNGKKEGFSISGNKKNELMKNIADLSRKELDRGIKNSIAEISIELLKINKNIIDMVAYESTSIVIDKRLLEKELKIKKNITMDHNKEKKILDRVKKQISGISAFPKEIAYMIENELIELSKIENFLKDTKELNFQRIKDIEIIKDEFRKLSKIIKNQNILIKNLTYFGKDTFFARVYSAINGKNHYIRHIGELLDLYNLENELYNDFFKRLYQNNYIVEKDEKERNMLSLYSEKQKMSQDISLLMRQLNVPKIRYSTKDYLVHTCTIKEAMQAITDERISCSDSYITRKARIGIEEYDLRFSRYFINTVEDKWTNEMHKICLIFDYEKIASGSFFIKEGDSLLKFEMPANNKEITNKAKTIIPYFDDAAKECDAYFNEWIDEAKKLDVNFQIKWDQKAKEIITSEFALRWIRDKSSYEKNRDVYSILLFYEHIEDLQKLDKRKFTEKLLEIKRRYSMHISDLEKMSPDKAKTDLNNAIFIAPRNAVLFWEKFFEGKKRPNVFYYDGETLKEGVKQAMDECITFGKGKQKSEKASEIYLIPKKISLKILNG